MAVTLDVSELPSFIEVVSVAVIVSKVLLLSIKIKSLVWTL